VFADVLTAIRLLTVVPVGRAEGMRALWYFPLVGYVFGAMSLAIAWGAARIGLASGAGALLTASVIVCVHAVFSGFLHWDGLADCADGLGVRGGAERALAAMKESGIGAFGVAAVVLVALLEVTAIAVVVESRSLWALAAAPVLGRLAASFALGLRPPARADGLGARYATRLPAAALVLLVVQALPLVAWAGHLEPALTLATFGGVLVAFFVPELFVRRFGGITGDVLGASILLTETAVLLTGALAGAPL
jgi:adenosylcobinamide-GDP ribazoletransferase